MSMVNGQVEVDRGRMVWELLVRPSMEYVAEVWWTVRRRACRKLELSQMKMGRRLLGEQHSSRSGSAGRSKVEEMEERREEVKVMFGKRLEVLEEGR